MSPKRRLPATDSAHTARSDWRHGAAADPTVEITVNIPVALREALDAVVVARNATRSGLIVMAVRAWLEREEARRTAGTAPEA